MTPQDLMSTLQEGEDAEAVMEIMHAFDKWLETAKGRTFGALLNELGIAQGRPERAAWNSAASVACLQLGKGATDLGRTMETVNAIQHAMLFAAWLGSRMERMGRGD
jgi:hypothetical protein